jgi:hypothetical protein
LAEATTLCTACRSASRNKGWSSAMTRWVLAAVIYSLARSWRYDAKALEGLFEENFNTDSVRLA